MLVFEEAVLLFMLHWRLRRRGRAQGQDCQVLQWGATSGRWGHMSVESVSLL